MLKGTLKTIEGDVTNPQRTAPNEIVIIAHVCNDEKIWGSGVVISISKKWKEPEQIYRDFCDKNKFIPILGKVCFARIDNYLVIANMIGQKGIVSINNSIPIKYKALADCMTEVVGFIETIPF